MIGVQVAEAHPLFLGHVAKVGMIGPMKTLWGVSEAAEEVPQFCHVAVKVAQGRAFALLVDLPQCLETPRPGDWHPEAAPLEDAIRIGKAGRSCDDQSEIEFVSVTQVADHLVCGHFSPATRSGRTNASQA